MLRLRVGSGRPYIQKAQGRHGNNSKSHNSLSLPNITCTPSCWPRRRRRGEKQWPEGFVPHTVWTREGWIGRLYKLHKMENTTKKASPDAEKQKNSLQPKSFFSNPKGELLHTCANSFLLCVCVSSCVLFHEWNPGSNSDEKGSSLPYVWPRWSQDGGVHAKTHPLREFYLKGSKTNGGRPGRCFERGSGRPDQLPVAPYSSFVSSTFSFFLLF